MSNSTDLQLGPIVAEVLPSGTGKYTLKVFVSNGDGARITMVPVIDGDRILDYGDIITEDCLIATISAALKSIGNLRLDWQHLTEYQQDSLIGDIIQRTEDKIPFCPGLLDSLRIDQSLFD